VSIITVCERREARGLDAHVPLILRDDALYDPDLDRFFLDLPLSGSARGTRFAPTPMMSLSGFAFSMPAARPCGLRPATMSTPIIVSDAATMPITG
jgi:hypothetical protein